MKDARAFWSAHRIATSIPAPLVGFIAWGVFKGLNSLTDIMQASLVSIASSLFAFVATVIVSLVRAPRTINDRKLEVIRSLTPSPLSPIQKQRLQVVKDAIDKHGDDVKSLLRHILVFGRIAANGGALPPEMDWPTAHALLPALKSVGIINEERIEPPGPLISDPVTQMMRKVATKTIWSIHEEMKESVRQVVFPT
jgi:hypothetical protein